MYFTAKELLKHVIDDGEMYHLYIFDIEMPEMNGLQLAKEIRKIDAKALFVFLTGYTQYVMDVLRLLPLTIFLNRLQWKSWSPSF